MKHNYFSRIAFCCLSFFFIAASADVAQPCGTHLLVEFWGCKTIDTAQEIGDILRAASVKANSSLLKLSVHKFEPQGVTGLALLAESHISLHTWPEKQYIAIDVFTCGNHTKPYKAVRYLREVFQPERVEIKEVKRGSNLATKKVKELMFERDTNLRRDEKEFGYELVLNLYDCDPETIRSGKRLVQFVTELCDLIKMKRFGEPFLERFALDSEIAAGYSVAQMIETSLISGHFSEYWNSAYINIFSCKAYDAELAIEFTKKFFGAQRVSSKLLIR